MATQEVMRLYQVPINLLSTLALCEFYAMRKTKTNITSTTSTKGTIAIVILFTRKIIFLRLYYYFYGYIFLIWWNSRGTISIWVVRVHAWLSPSPSAAWINYEIGVVGSLSRAILITHSVAFYIVKTYIRCSFFR